MHYVFFFFFFKVDVKSTDYDRTIMTAQSVVTGLYPATIPDWAPGPWQPIPIHSIKEANDQLFGKAPCKKLMKLTSDHDKSHSFEKEFKDKYQVRCTKIMFCDFCFYCVWMIFVTVCRL